MLRDVKGQIVAQKVPPKRGRNVTPTQANQMSYFQAVQRVFAYLPPHEKEYWMKLAEGGPFLPRDFWTSNCYQRFLGVITEDGKTIMPVRSMFDISSALDVIAQTEGQLLYRSEDLWEGLLIGAPNEVLTVDPSTNLPAWRQSAGGGGGSPWAPPAIADWTIRQGGVDTPLIATTQPGIGAAIQPTGALGNNVWTKAANPNSEYIIFGISALSNQLTETFISLGWGTGLTTFGAQFQLYFPNTASGFQIRARQMSSVSPWASSGTIGTWPSEQIGPLFLKLARDGNEIVYSVGTDPQTMGEVARLNPSWEPADLNLAAILFVNFGQFARGAAFQIFHYEEG